MKFGDYAIGEFDERMDLYRRLEKEGVGISVMKAFCGGKLLDADKSPFHQVLTETQCMQYALDKPAVLTVLPGIRNDEDLIVCHHCDKRCPFHVQQSKRMQEIDDYFH